MYPLSSAGISAAVNTHFCCCSSALKFLAAPVSLLIQLEKCHSSGIFFRSPTLCRCEGSLISDERSAACDSVVKFDC